MNIVKSLHSSLLHKCFSHQEKHYFTASILWGFNLQTGEPVLEQELWKTIGDMLGKNELFDAGMPKPNAELLVSGSCFSANGEAIEANKVSVSLGAISKELYVFGDRHWIKGLGVSWGLSNPVPFTEMPISYSNAFGGKDYAPNPLGKGLDEIESETGPFNPLPNIEYANQLVGSPNDKPQPASLNRTDMMCAQRMSNAGTYDQKYIEKRMPDFPDDLNYDYFNDAAKDQQINNYFNGDEQYEIRNMNPNHPLIKGEIPSVYGRAFVNHEINGEIEFKEITTSLDTVWFFPSTELGVLIYRGTIEVSEDDAADIKQILIANENRLDTPRELSHYKNELTLRTHPEEAFKYLLYTAPLIPNGCVCGFKTIQEDDTFPLELLSNNNMETFTEAKKQEAEETTNKQLEEMKKELSDSGVSTQEIDDLTKKIVDAKDKPVDLSPDVQKIKDLMEKILPGTSDNPKNIDLSKLNLKAMDEFNAHMEKIQKAKKAEAKNSLIDQLEKLKKSDQGLEPSAHMEQLENIITEMDLPPILPRIDVDEIIGQFKSQMDEMQKKLVVMKSMGASDEQLEKVKSSIDMDQIDKQSREGLNKAKDGYRIGAHYVEKARSPHEGQEDDIRDQLIDAYQRGTKTSEGDYAFVDLSNLDLTGIDLSGAYLEYANLTNTNFSNANLSKAILSHAIINGTIFTKTNLNDANLGAIEFDGAVFTKSDLTGAILSKSKILNTQFIQCKMAEKIDMFLETKFDKASFVDSDLHRSSFIDAKISGCSFSGSDLSESNFVNPIMKETDFSHSNLTGTTFVSAQADDSIFDHATMKNVRFVAESSLVNASFHSANVSESNLRECNLQNSKFTEAVLHKADFGGAKLNRAEFQNARAVQAQFNKADLTYANMQKIDLMEGSLYKAILSGAMFNNANLYGVNFIDSTVGQTDFTGAYLEQTIIKDWRPS